VFYSKKKDEIKKIKSAINTIIEKSEVFRNTQNSVVEKKNQKELKKELYDIYYLIEVYLEVTINHNNIKYLDSLDVKKLKVELYNLTRYMSLIPFINGGDNTEKVNLNKEFFNKLIELFNEKTKDLDFYMKIAQSSEATVSSRAASRMGYILGAVAILQAGQIFLKTDKTPPIYDIAYVNSNKEVVAIRGDIKKSFKSELEESIQEVHEKEVESLKESIKKDNQEKVRIIKTNIELIHQQEIKKLNESTQARYDKSIGQLRKRIECFESEKDEEARAKC
jgi:hypothetical protein